jgi:tetratricopeptide (TPR) repeat protein
MAEGKFEEALDNYRRAAALDPRSPDPPAGVAGARDQLGRYGEAIPWAERHIALNPANQGGYIANAERYLLWRGDTAAARRLIAQAIDVAGRALVVREVARYFGVGPVYVRALDPETQHALDTASLPALHLPPDWYHLLKGRLSASTGRPGSARAHFDSARAVLEPMLRDSTSPLGLSAEGIRLALATAYSGLGRHERAVQLAGSALQLAENDLRHAQGAIQRWNAVQDVADIHYRLAVLYARANEVEKAVEQLEYTTGRAPPVSPALLRLDPTWDPLRSNPRFQRLLDRGR